MEVLKNDVHFWVGSGDKILKRHKGYRGSLQAVQYPTNQRSLNKRTGKEGESAIKEILKIFLVLKKLSL